MDNSHLTKEEQWAQGIHITSKGDTLRLEEIATPHLHNIVNKAKREGQDTTHLEKELSTREE